MRRIACLVVAALCGAAADAQSLLDCVDPDVLHGLLLSGQGERAPVITTQVPAELSALKMPGGFSWIASAERPVRMLDATTSASQVTAAWRSSLAPDAARTAALAALAASGWEIRPQPGIGPVFGSAQFGQPVCRDGQPVTVTASALGGATYVLMSMPRGNTGNSVCNQQARPAFARGNGLDAHLPRLEMPADPATGEVTSMRSGGTSGGSGAFTAHAEFTTGESVGNIARHFARQMAGQGWTSDADWSGSSTAGSSWSRRVDSGAPLQVTLSVTAVDEQQFMAALRLIRLQ